MVFLRQVPPITAVLGGFGSAQRISEDFPECSRNSHSMKNILGKNILQFGFVLSELIKNCREAEEFEEVSSGLYVGRSYIVFLLVLLS